MKSSKTSSYSFSIFLEENFLTEKRKAIVALLKELNIHHELELEIDGLFIVLSTSAKHKVITHFVMTTSKFVSTINNRLKEVTNENAKFNMQKLLSELSAYLIKEIFVRSSLSREDFFELLRESLHATYEHNGWNLKQLNEFLNLDNLKAFSSAVDAQRESSVIILPKTVCLEWVSDKPVDLFIDDVMNLFPRIKSKRTLFKLFDPLDDDFTITIPSQHLPLFLQFFHIAHEDGIVKVRGSRGLFKYLEKHVIPPYGDKFKNRDFRKIRHESILDGKLDKEIQKKITPLINLYRAVESRTKVGQ